ncbi:MAG: 50S ribosomal protein L25 [Betaproteobacteria bacterium]|jgi:large subunit ribosomal protein L25|nr:50S ribosomal protein L25/general stress protein Ctc [Rhodocyclaceae bacterium]MCG3186583.1 50S ribosomal protein L25 [Rhodocyclaceae bacterium]
MKIEINASKRTVQGRSASRRLRRAERVPAIVYGGAAQPQALELDHNSIYHQLRIEAMHSSVLTLNIEGTRESVLLRDVQMHPYKPRVLHVDFQRVDASHRLHQKVPLHFINQDVAPGVKLAHGMVSHALTELDVRCLPDALPEFVEVDLKDLGAGQAIHVSQLNLPPGVEPVIHKGEDPVVVSILAPRGQAAGEEAAGEAS